MKSIASTQTLFSNQNIANGLKIARIAPISTIFWRNRSRRADLIFEQFSRRRKIFRAAKIFHTVVVVVVVNLIYEKNLLKFLPCPVAVELYWWIQNRRRHVTCWTQRHMYFKLHESIWKSIVPPVAKNNGKTQKLWTDVCPPRISPILTILGQN